MKKLKKKVNERGFGVYNFKDRYGIGCSIQKSSLASEDAIWMGCDDANPQIMASQTQEGGNGWVEFPIPDGVIMTTRMHLTQKQVKKMLPILTKFSKTGEI